MKEKQGKRRAWVRSVRHYPCKQDKAYGAIAGAIERCSQSLGVGTEARLQSARCEEMEEASADSSFNNSG